jgi:hypothetical protein
LLNVDNSTQEPEPVDVEALQVTVEPYIGYRGWVLHRSGSFPSLRPITNGGRGWRPGVNVAQCHTGHLAPNPGCGCGLWAYDDPWKVTGDVLGVVVGWGVLIRGDYGMRCEKAQIAALFALERTNEAEYLERIYKVPVVDDLDRLRIRGERMRDYMMGTDESQGES